MKCAIMQPTYMPWVGYFALIDSVDKFVFLDDVKLEKSSWHVRNRIKTNKGELFITVPVNLPFGRMKTNINQAVIDKRTKWNKKHLKTFICNYSKAKYFEEVMPLLEEYYNKDYLNLADFNINLIKAICKYTGINTDMYVASSLDVGSDSKKDARLSDICNLLTCKEYLSVKGSAVYLESKEPGGQIVGNGIDLYYFNYEHPVYKQIGDDFLPYMGVIDLLFNEGIKNALPIIRKGIRDAIYYLDYRKVLKQEEVI